MKEMWELKEELSHIEGEEERQAWFESLVKEFDKVDGRNDRRHCRKEHRSFDSVHALDQSGEQERPIVAKFKELCNSDIWLDTIFSQKAEDLQNLVTDEKLIKILSGLSDKRKEVLFYRVIHGYSTEEIASLRGVSSRNIRKLYEKALAEIREAFDK